MVKICIISIRRRYWENEFIWGSGIVNKQISENCINVNAPKYFINCNISEINPSMIIGLKILLTPITFFVAIENEVVNILNLRICSWEFNNSTFFVLQISLLDLIIMSGGTEHTEWHWGGDKGNLSWNSYLSLQYLWNNCTVAASVVWQLKYACTIPLSTSTIFNSSWWIRLWGGKFILICQFLLF